jgi:hypothetical protein
MKKPIYLVFLGIVLMVLGVTFVFIEITKEQKTIYREYDRIKYLKDSLEMEYYKKQLETFPFDHSEIKDTTVKTLDKW